MSVLAMASPMLYMGYFLTQAVILVQYIWAMYSVESPEPVFQVCYSTGLSVLLDSFLIGVSWEDEIMSRYAVVRFSAAMTIILIIAKPVLAILLFNEGRQRATRQGVASPSFGQWANAGTSAAPHQPVQPAPVQPKPVQPAQYGSYQEQI